MPKVFNDYQALQRNLTKLKSKTGITGSEAADIDIAKRLLNRVNMKSGGHSNMISIEDIDEVMDEVIGDKK